MCYPFHSRFSGSLSTIPILLDILIVLPEEVSSGLLLQIALFQSLHSLSLPPSLPPRSAIARSGWVTTVDRN